MQSYTFASDEAMAAVLAAYGTDREVAWAGGYEITLGSTDTVTLSAALVAYAGGQSGAAREMALTLLTEVTVQAYTERYDGRWSLEVFTVATAALRTLWEAAPATDADKSVHDNAGSLLSGIAETLGVEFV